MAKQDADQYPISEEQQKEINRLLTDLKRERPRGRVILAGIKLDILLRSILEEMLLRSPTRKDDLLGADRPLGALGARVTMIYRLGLIQQDLANALRLVGRIRDGFAHDLSVAPIEVGTFRQRVKDTVMAIMVHPVARETRDSLVKQLPDSTEALADFLFLVGALAAKLQAVLNRTKRLDDSDAWPLVVRPHDTC